MNLVETLELLRELRRSGATHFKSQDFEVTMGASNAISDPVPGAAVHSPVESKEGAPVLTPETKVATEKLQGLIDTLKLDDMALVDKIFPAGAGG